MNNNEIKQNKINRSLIISSIILALIIVLTWALKFMEISENKETEKTKDKIEQVQTEIDKIKENELVQVEFLKRKNSSLLEEKERVNQIPGHVKALKEIADKYDFALKGFDYRSGKIETTAYALNSNEDGLTSYDKVQKMLEEYRMTPKEERLFNVKFVESFKWDSKIEFRLALTLTK